MISNFRNFMKSNEGKMFLSIILGIGLASLFRKSCNGKRCMRFIGPHISKIENKVYKFNDKCYKYKPNAETCSKKKKQVHFDTNIAQ
jgi:hypothetical protein